MRRGTGAEGRLLPEYQANHIQSPLLTLTSEKLLVETLSQLLLYRRRLLRSNSWWNGESSLRRKLGKKDTYEPEERLQQVRDLAIFRGSGGAEVAHGGQLGAGGRTEASRSPLPPGLMLVG